MPGHKSLDPINASSPICFLEGKNIVCFIQIERQSTQIRVPFFVNYFWQIFGVHDQVILNMYWKNFDRKG